MEKVCALGFDTVVKTVIASYTGQTAFTPAGSARRFDEAKNILISTSLYNPQEFDGVEFRFCRLTGTSAGLTYDRDKVCITDHYSDGTHLRDLTSTLAHEMFHVRQYRARGTDNFKCEYSKQMSRNGFRQDRGMDMERDAYEFQDRAEAVIDLYLATPRLFGAYRLAAGQYCQPQRQHAYITSSDGRLVAVNECGSSTPIEFANGRLRAINWNVGARFDGKETITWDNGSIWARPRWDGVAGEYFVTEGQYCRPFGQLPTVSRTGTGWTVTNECGQSSTAEVPGDGRIIAIDWKLTGHIDQAKAAIYWANKTIWAK